MDEHTHICPILTPSVLHTKIWKPPNVAQTDGVSNAGQNEISLVAPVTSLRLIALIIIFPLRQLVSLTEI